jgi:hypothetical protein
MKYCLTSQLADDIILLGWSNHRVVFVLWLFDTAVVACCGHRPSSLHKKIKMPWVSSSLLLNTLCASGPRWAPQLATLSEDHTNAGVQKTFLEPFSIGHRHIKNTRNIWPKGSWKACGDWTANTDTASFRPSLPPGSCVLSWCHACSFHVTQFAAQVVCRWTGFEEII